MANLDLVILRADMDEADLVMEDWLISGETDLVMVAEKYFMHTPERSLILHRLTHVRRPEILRSLVIVEMRRIMEERSPAALPQC